MDCDISESLDSECSDEDRMNKINAYVEALLTKAMPLLPQEHRIILSLPQSNLNKENKALYLRKALLCVLRYTKSTIPPSSDGFLSVNDCKITKDVIKTAVYFGILCCLLPGVGSIAIKQRSKAFHLFNEKLSENEKYERLASTVRVATDRFTEPEMRPLLLPYLDLILAGLLQLSYVPLAKPQPVCNTKTAQTIEKSVSGPSKMTDRLYQSLLKDQEEFRDRLEDLIENCPKVLSLRVLMLIHGAADVPKWMQRRTQMLLKNAIVKDNGTFALFQAVCGDNIDLGVHWEKLDTITRLITSICIRDFENCKTICSQLIDLLESGKDGHGSTFAKNCIIALYESNPSIVVEKVIHVIAAPLLPFGWIYDPSKRNSSRPVVRSEEEVTRCIDRLTSYFYPRNGTFDIPFNLIQVIAVPLFSLHVKAQGSVVPLKNKIKQLLTGILKESTSRHQIFEALLQHTDGSKDFGVQLFCSFAGSGGLEITNQQPELPLEIADDALLDLVADDESLAFDLFVFLIEFFSHYQQTKESVPNKNASFAGNRLEKSVLESLVIRMEGVRMLSNLSETRAIREGLMKNAEPLVSLIKSLFEERTAITPDKDLSTIEATDGALFTSLMLVKAIATKDGTVAKDWRPLDQLMAFLRKVQQSGMPGQLLQSQIIQEVIEAIENRGRSKLAQRYQDLNLDNRKNESSNFAKALNDLTDPLLPVRAHGLMSMTKLIESGDPETIAKKDIVLCFFHENLKNEDSFIYLAAINGLCALSVKFPDNVIQTLVQEFIAMPLRDNSGGEISVETRVKLGEILVKATRGLGEMAAAHKQILINGFLCGARDSNDTIRASSLSCLGELSKVLGFRLGDATIEIFYCIKCIIESDKSAECRRAAVLVAYLLIRGLGEDVLTSLGRDLVDIYRTLKFLRDRDEDQVLRLHVQLALEELDVIMHSQLSPGTTIKKNRFA